MMRHAGIIVNDIAVQHSADDHFAHTILIPDRGYKLRLELHNTQSSLIIHRPTKEELDSLERVEITAPGEWIPDDPVHNEMENIAMSRRKYGDAEVMNKEIEIYGVMSTTMNTNSVNIGMPRYLGRHLSISGTNSYHHPHHAYQQISESRRVMCDVSGTLDPDTLMQRMIGATNLTASVSKTRHAGRDPERLARTFGVGLPTAKQTLEATTQQHIRQSDGSGGISRRLRSMHKGITDRYKLKVRFYTDVMKIAIAAIGGAKLASVFSTAYHFTTVIPMLNERKETIGRAFKEFLIRCGIPFQMVTDNHNSYVGKDSDFHKICRNKDIQQLAIEPYSHWQNQAEAAIRELKRLFNKVQKSTGMPRKLWDHLLEWCSDIRNITALNIPELHGRTPFEKVMGYNFSPPKSKTCLLGVCICFER